MKGASKAEAIIYLDEIRPKKNGKCSVKIKVTYNRKRKYYSTGVELVPEEFQQIIGGKRRTNEQKEINTKLTHLCNKALDIIDELTVFNFELFEEGFLEHRNTTNSVSFAFDKYIKQLKLEDRIGTASSYNCAKNSLEVFKKDLTFGEITSSFLKKYEGWMIKNGKSETTVGIYLRSLRTIFNEQSIDKSIYPFGTGKNKYTIPSSKNIKKALSLDEISRIFHYEASLKSTKDMAKDYWLFLYLSNGMNVKDFCLLKWKNIKDDMIYYKRAKTVRSKREIKQITIALKPHAKTIIEKWGSWPKEDEKFIFPHLNEDIPLIRQRAIYQQLTKIINKYVGQIALETGIKKKVTTQYARHSFATILKRSGANVNFISELLGHSSVDVTESYLDSFEKEHIQQTTDALTAGLGNEPSK